MILQENDFIFVAFFLELNGIKIDATNEEVAKLGLDVAGGSANNEDILKWINEHKV